MWAITKNDIEPGNDNHATSPDFTNAVKLEHSFRLLDADGGVYFHGLSDDSSSFAPLDDYGVAFGCTDIEYLAAGRWVGL